MPERYQTPKRLAGWCQLQGLVGGVLSERERDPGMLLVFIHRLHGCRKRRVGKAADCHRDEFRLPAGLPEDGGSAMGAEMEGDLGPAVGRPVEAARVSPNVNCRTSEECGESERAAGSALAIEAVAQGDRLRISVTFDREPLASTGGEPSLGTHLRILKVAATLPNGSAMSCGPAEGSATPTQSRPGLYTAPGRPNKGRPLHCLVGQRASAP